MLRFRFGLYEMEILREELGVSLDCILSSASSSPEALLASQMIEDFFESVQQRLTITQSLLDEQFSNILK